jgi:hypothetical protein
MNPRSIILLLMLSISVVSPKERPAAEPQSPGRAAFEQFKQLSGNLQSKSTRGRESTDVVRTIAGGSVVELDSTGAHPGETMLTLIYMDGDRLLLTHYCVAKNQPRLQATRFEDGGRTVTFTFLDATNLPSRDTGHMDSLVFHFNDDGSATRRWTWYQERKASWTETIEMRRTPGP